MAHEEEAEFDCPDCHAQGFLHFKAYDKKMQQTYTYIAICDRCEAYKKVTGSIRQNGGKLPHKNEGGQWIHDGEYVPAMLRTNVDEIKRRGWQLLAPENRFAVRWEIERQGAE